MKWKILVESSPNTWTDAGLDIWSDGFADDGSEWGDEESNAITAKQLELQDLDPQHRSYAMTWAGNM